MSDLKYRREDDVLPLWKPLESPRATGGAVRALLGSGRASPRQLLVLVALCLLTTAALSSVLVVPTVTPGWLRLEALGPRRAVHVERRDAVRRAMKFVWTNYRTRAFGADELAPLTGLPVNPWGGVGCMILDSMDTLWIMGMQAEFHEARNWVATKLRFDGMGEISVFETIIRSVGGLLSAYDLSRDRIFLDKAQELTERLLPAIDPTTGRADYLLDTTTNRSSRAGSLAESGTYQLEFEYLSRETGNPKYHTISRQFYRHLVQQTSIQLDGLYANQLRAMDSPDYLGRLTATMGAGGDSFYEYLLKVWILSGQRDDDLLKRMYLDAVDGMEELMLQQSKDGHYYLADYDIGRHYTRHQMQHLACFVPGMLALGSRRLEKTYSDVSRRHLLLAKELMRTCYEAFYKKQPTQLSPEFLDGPDLEVGGSRQHLLRPEVVESLFVLHSITGDGMYQEWGWEIFSAIDRHCRVRYGYAILRDVTTTADVDDRPVELNDWDRQLWEARFHDNKMETFFTAETLKYLYLLLGPKVEYVNLDTHVFNTEAHPLSIVGSQTSIA